MEEKSKKTRHNWTADEKLGIIRKHFLKTKLVDTCEENQVHPSMVSNWFKIVLEAGREALLGTNKKELRDREKLIEKYERELQKKNEVIAELSGEVLELKKKSGAT